MNYLMKISYDGSKYYGFQKLKNHNTVQSELENALTTINKSEVSVKGAGRTDRGVHALNQGVTFKLDVKVPIDRLKNALNRALPPSIHVNELREVDEVYHARFDAKGKIYKYIINCGEADPIKNDYQYNLGKRLNIKKMKQAFKYLKGLHNFEGLTSGPRTNYDSVIYDIKIVKKKDIVTITFSGKSFFRYMVRNIVGILVLIGLEKIEPIEMKKVIDTKRNKYDYSMVTASGLYLVDVLY